MAPPSRPGRHPAPQCRAGNLAGIEVRAARSAADYASFGELLQEYLAGLGFDVDFQDVDRELRELERDYGDRGVALLATEAGETVGVVGVRRFDDATAELKRMYVRPAARGRGLGALLCDAAIVEARRLGFARLRLDTLTRMAAAVAVYRAAGFVDIPAYRFNPLPDALFLEREL